MKNGDRGKGDHIVPLSGYAMAVFRELYAVTGRHELIFPSLKHPGEAISEGAWLNALYRMGYKDKATVHGLRALGSTTANECYVTVDHVPVPGGDRSCRKHVPVRFAQGSTRRFSTLHPRAQDRARD